MAINYKNNVKLYTRHQIHYDIIKLESDIQKSIKYRLKINPDNFIRRIMVVQLTSSSKAPTGLYYAGGAVG